MDSVHRNEPHRPLAKPISGCSSSGEHIHRAACGHRLPRQSHRSVRWADVGVHRQDLFGAVLHLRNALRDSSDSWAGGVRCSASRTRSAQRKSRPPTGPGRGPVPAAMPERWTTDGYGTEPVVLDRSPSSSRCGLARTTPCGGTTPPKRPRSGYVGPQRSILYRIVQQEIHRLRHRNLETAAARRASMSQRQPVAFRTARCPRRRSRSRFVPVALDPNSTARSTRSLAAITAMIASRCASLRPSVISFAWCPESGGVVAAQGGSVP